MVRQPASPRARAIAWAVLVWHERELTERAPGHRCGTVTSEEVLREKYAYLNDVRDINRARLQELLDNAKQGKPGGHEAGEAWDTNPTFHGPWDRPTRAGEKPKGV